MFEVIGDKERLKPAMNRFVMETNDTLHDEMEEELKENLDEKIDFMNKLPKVQARQMADKVINKIPFDKIYIAYDETEDGYEVKIPFASDISKKKVIGKVIKFMLRKSKKSLEEYFEIIQLCPECEIVTEEDKCPECGSEDLEDIKYEIR